MTTPAAAVPRRLALMTYKRPLVHYLYIRVQPPDEVFHVRDLSSSAPKTHQDKLKSGSRRLPEGVKAVLTRTSPSQAQDASQMVLKQG